MALSPPPRKGDGPHRQSSAAASPSGIKPTLDSPLGCHFGRDSPGPKYAPRTTLTLPNPAGTGAAWPREPRFAGRPDVAYSPPLLPARSPLDYVREEMMSTSKSSPSHHHATSPVSMMKTPTVSSGPNSPHRASSSFVSRRRGSSSAGLLRRGSTSANHRAEKESRAAAEELDRKAAIRAAVKDRVLHDVLTCPEDLNAFAAASSATAKHRQQLQQQQQANANSHGGRGNFGAKWPPLANPHAQTPLQGMPGPGRYEGLLPPRHQSTKRFRYLHQPPRPNIANVAVGDGPGKFYLGVDDAAALSPIRSRSPCALLTGGGHDDP